MIQMASPQSSPLHAPPGLLLLLLLLEIISAHLPKVHAAPISFWCDSERRKMMMELVQNLSDCRDSDVLNSSVQLCVVVRMEAWENKTLPQKHAEVLMSFHNFLHGVTRARNQTTSHCQDSVLEELEHSAKNHLAIVRLIKLEENSETPSSSELHCTNQTSLKNVTKEYNTLLTGKLNLFAGDFCDRLGQNSP